MKNESEAVTTTDDAVESTEKKEEVPVVEKIKDSWDASSSSEDESEEVKKGEEIAAKVESEEESDDDESEDESDDDEDESDSDNKSDGDVKTDAEAKREKAWERILVSCSLTRARVSFIIPPNRKFSIRNVVMLLNKSELKTIYAQLLYVSSAMSIRERLKFWTNFAERMFKMVKLVVSPNKLAPQMFPLTQLKSKPELLKG